MRDKPYFAVIYMFILTAFFSALLIGFSRMTRQRVQMNEQLNFEWAVVQAFPKIQYQNNQQIHQIFTKQFAKDEQIGAYLYQKDGRLQGYAVPFSGKGFWDKIEGVIGIAADKKTITGVSFYEQKETPGLGARIDEDEFRRQFIGKTIEDGPKPIGIVPSAQTLAENQVHAVTGATQTSIRLEALMNQDIRAWLDAVEKKEVAP
ncbi:MAG: FMN-binding protein [Phycisphaerae bacterium]|nr:FMN-binding protein [Phycisphaerae bacterium]